MLQLVTKFQLGSELLQIVEHVFDVGIARQQVFAQGLAENLVKLGWGVCAKLRNRWLMFVDYREEIFRLRLSRERFAPRNHLIKHDSQTEDVRPRRESFTAHLLRRHVADRPQQATGIGEVKGIVLGIFFTGLRSSLNQLSDSTVENLHQTVRTHHYVLRLDVPVHYPGIMSSVERPGQLNT